MRGNAAIEKSQTGLDFSHSFEMTTMYSRKLVQFLPTAGRRVSHLKEIFRFTQNDKGNVIPCLTRNPIQNGEMLKRVQHDGKCHFEMRGNATIEKSQTGLDFSHSFEMTIRIFVKISAIRVNPLEIFRFTQNDRVGQQLEIAFCSLLIVHCLGRRSLPRK